MPDNMTPGGWLQVLEPRLDVQARACQRYRDYYDGRHKLLFATEKFRQAFGGLFRELADNWCPIVVDAAVERLAVMGFRFGQDNADRDAWAIWQANRLDAESIQAFTEAVKCGRSYLLISPPTGDEAPRITIEHPQQVVVACAKGDRGHRLAALKRWLDDDGYAYATLYLPDVLVKWRSQKPVRGAGGRINWQLRRDDPGGPNPLNEVPIVAIENNPDMLAGGISDLATAIPLQDAVNKLCTDMLVASEFNAYPQRWATGLQVPTVADTDVPDTAALLKASQGHVWISEDGDTKFGQLAAGDLNNYVTGMETLIQHLAAQTRTPPHYLLAKMVNLSGDALKAAETGLVARVKRKHIDFSDSLEEAMRLAFRAAGDTTRARQLDAETIWRDPESRAPGVIADSLVKKRQIGVPLEVLWEEAGYTPQQIERMKRLAGLPDRPPPGATTQDVPSSSDSANGAVAASTTADVLGGFPPA